MNRFSLLIVYKPYKPRVNDKISRLADVRVDKKLRKPSLAFQLWGPKYHNVDVNEDEDESANISDIEYSTFCRVNVEDCPAFTDSTLDRSKKAHFQDGKSYYPCNFGCCLKPCPCIPCKSGGIYKFCCPKHNPSHPDQFDEINDLAIPRRRFVTFDSKTPIYKRPMNHKNVAPPKIRLAGLKKKCKPCKKIFSDHRRNHLILPHGSFLKRFFQILSKQV